MPPALFYLPLPPPPGFGPVPPMLNIPPLFKVPPLFEPPRGIFEL